MKNEWQKGSVVVSTQGYDKGKVYIVLKANENRALLVDGNKRLLQNPKPKNLKHLRKANIVFEFDESQANTANGEINKFVKSLQKMEI